jgi:hypothetical protein
MFIYLCSSNDAVNGPQYTASNGKVTSEWTIWKCEEGGMIYTELISQLLSGGKEVNH